MSTPFPFGLINLGGYGHMRGVTLARPTDSVRNLLPAGLELGDQDVTPKGTHPIILLFNDMYRAELSFPNLLPSMTYHEHFIAIPFAFLSRTTLIPGYPGPYYYLVKGYLDSFFATIGGRFLWGLPKELTNLKVTANQYTVYNPCGRRLTSLAWNTHGENNFRPLAELPNFSPIREMLSRPIVSMMPAAVGPFFVTSDFHIQWEAATLRPLQTTVEVDVAFVPGYECGRYPASGRSPGIDRSVLGSYELQAPWKITTIYPPMLANGERT
jgi:hypothetical protein